jgi:hypothetical protein
MVIVYVVYEDMYLSWPLSHSAERDDLGPTNESGVWFATRQFRKTFLLDDFYVQNDVF